MTHTTPFYFEITQFAVKNWPGVSGFTPRTLFTRIAVYAIPVECGSVTLLSLVLSIRVTL
jgi:hypothetical protein